MSPQSTVLLEHVTRTGRHYDWLVGDPVALRLAGPGARLWTVRVGVFSRHWLVAGRLEMIELPPHRRAYLSYQGPISGGRGTVRQVDAGVVRPQVWTPSRRVLEVQMRYCMGLVVLRRLTPDRWTGVVRPGCLTGKTGKTFAGGPAQLL